MCDADVKIHVLNMVQRGQKGATEVERVHGSGSSRLSGRSVAMSSVAKSSRLAQPSHSDDTDANSSWNDSSERECCDHVGQGTSTYSSHSGKDSAMETTESKSSNSPSPPSSSRAYSLLSGGSEQDQPSTSGYSSERPARLQTQKELLRALRELKMRMPTDQRAKGRSSTLTSLQYALKCVKQVRANQEYYHQWSIEESHGCCLDLSTFTIEELDNITSEYTLQNPDTFSVAVSFLSGKVVYISPHASSLLHCKQEKLQGVLFSELLAPQDIRTFYSGTAPCHLPLWASSTRAGSTVDGVQEKPMFCRLSGGRECAGDVTYCPFRLTPSKLSLCASDTAQPEPCCLLIAERVHSGYEAPRIPTDKRIFTTSHTPNCLFQEVDERAVPLLGYLPQDLIGTPLLLYIHPEDRSVIVDIHKKIVQYAGQPFEQSSLRMWARSGEYLTIDTSWSSFINPWSRKVAFIVGRHKVRTSPLNEDVFTATGQGAVRAPSPEVTLLSEQIHRILVPPIHCSSALLYSNVGSRGSTELQASGADSSDNNAPPARDRPPAGRVNLPQMCDDVLMQCSEQQVYTASCNKATPLKTTCTGDMVNPAGTECTSREIQQVATHGPKSQVSTLLPGKGLPVTYSYQQINCLDSIIRYLESCNVPNTVKRKCGSSSCTTSSTSDDGKHRKAAGLGRDLVNTLQAAEGSKVVPMEPAHPLTPLALHYKAESVVSVTSQCSFSSTIVHVGDKKPPESDILMMEESLTTPTPAPQNCTSSQPPGVTPQTGVSPRTAASETEGKRGGGGVPHMGLTKEVLSNHTEREEQDFLSRFSDLSQLYLIQSSKPPCKNATMPGVKGSVKGIRNSQDYPPGGGSGRRRGRRGKRIKHQSESPFIDTQALPTPGPCVPQASSAKGPSASVFPSSQDMCVGPQASTPPWPASVSTQAHGLPITSPYPPDCLPFYPLYPSFPVPPVQADPRMQTDSPSSHVDSRLATQGSHLLPAAAAPPVMAFIMFPHLSGAGSQLATSVQHLGQNGPEPIQFNHLPAQFSPGVGHMTLDTMSLNQFNPPGSLLNPSPAQLAMPLQFYNPPNVTFGFQNRAPEALSPATAIAVPPHRGPSRSSTPQSTSQLAEHEGVRSPLFNSRCSSPLNLLQLEEIPSNRTDTTQRTPPPGGCHAQGAQTSGTCSSSKDNTEVNESNQDAMSTSSDLLDLLLHEDSRSGTSSAASGFGSSGSASNGCSTAGSGTRSNNTSKYFGSVESSEHDQGLKATCGEPGEEHFMKYVLQEPAWLAMANTDEEVMMTYQLPSRDRDTVLQKDREALKSVHMQQPIFTEQQCRELSEVHPWLQSGLLPTAVSTSSCRGCGSPTEAASAPPFDLELTEMEFSGDLREEGNLASSAVVPWRRGEDLTAEPSPAAKACGEVEVTSSGEVQCREA